MLLLAWGVCFSQVPAGSTRIVAAYPPAESAAAWRALAAGYVRKAIADHTLNRDPVLNARVDRVMAAVGVAAAAIDPRFAASAWKAILIEDFGHGAVAFPGQIVLIDANFVRKLTLNDDELALIMCHEVAHILAGHASAKLSFMAEFLGKDKLPTARAALLEYLARDAYAEAFRARALMQEREADRIGAAILFVTGYDPQRALGLFDKLAQLEARAQAPVLDSHDTAAVRKQAVASVIAELRRRESAREPERR
ncbi:MAG: M48 family metalloprotease [Burkholderiales bacterium]